eukprot:CCRYP_020004-RA/>CCRYP_020004-RA protein AED:0.48 eAED:0.48 QI:0/-1/0/1/-1/1/1/0/72
MVEIEDFSDAGESDNVSHELLSFLSSPSEDLRQAAAEAALASLVSGHDNDNNNNDASHGPSVNHETTTKLAR